MVHADQGTPYPACRFCHRLRAARLLGSMDRVASSADTALIESFWSTMQRQGLDRQSWSARGEVPSAGGFERIEGWCKPRRRHSLLESRHKMTAPHIGDPASLLGEALAETSPDLMRSLL